MNDPDRQNLDHLARTGVEALQRGDAGTARRAFSQLTTSGRASPQAWLLLAQACVLQDDRASAREALAPVMAADPDNPYALIIHGELLTRDGDDRAAIGWYDRALGITAGAQNLPPDLVQGLARAKAARDAATGRFEKQLRAGLDGAGVDTAAAGPRFAEALAILAGKAQPCLQQPSSFYFPGLAQQAFFDPVDFAWAAALEAAFPAIAAEAEAVLADRASLTPYVAADPSRPSIGKDLLEDPRWSAFHLIKDGKPVPASTARCPATMAALEGLPIPVIRARSPMVLFSILAPATHIKPHHGLLNTRLICHLPLVVPPGCWLRVGNHKRPVEAGKLMIFDDSIEHEAANDSSAPRLILLFEIWRPDLTEAERTALTAMYESVSAYGA
jgi:aspartyl/asparaginyl beta-hydroxylase (cupin superfamily)